MWSLLCVLALARATSAFDKDATTTEAQLGSRDWTLTKFSNENYPEARCLDGTYAGYWFLKGSGDGADKFVVHHMGKCCILPRFFLYADIE